MPTLAGLWPAEALDSVRLLIVEDELDLATALATGLRREGYAVDTAATAAEARERLLEVERRREDAADLGEDGGLHCLLHY